MTFGPTHVAGGVLIIVASMPVYLCARLLGCLSLGQVEDTANGQGQQHVLLEYARPRELGDGIVKNVYKIKLAW